MAGDARTRILEAAKALAESHDSVQGVTISLESVAHQAGLTKPGLMYHFPSKQALMVGVVDHAAEHWAQMLAGQAGKPVGELSSFERHRAYVTVATTAEVSRADYWIFSDALYHPTLAEAWSGHLGPWFDTVGLDAQAVSLLTAARFCADGAWMSEATGVFRFDRPRRRARTRPRTHRHGRKISPQETAVLRRTAVTEPKSPQRQVSAQRPKIAPLPMRPHRHRHPGGDRIEYRPVCSSSPSPSSPRWPQR